MIHSQKLQNWRRRLSFVLASLIIAGGLSPNAAAQQGSGGNVANPTSTFNTATGIITTSAGSAVQIPFSGMGCVGTVISGAFTGNLAFQQSNDGVLWQPADALQQLVGKWIETTGGIGRFYSGGFSASFFRVAGPTASGSATITLQTSQAPCNMYVFSIPGIIAGNGLAGVAATGTQTSVPDAIDGEKTLDVIVSWSGITGSPVGCTIQVQGSGNGLLYINTGPAQSVTPGTNQIFTISGGLGIATQIVYACGTYPTGGTITAAEIFKP